VNVEIHLRAIFWYWFSSDLILVYRNWRQTNACILLLAGAVEVNALAHERHGDSLGVCGSNTEPYQPHSIPPNWGEATLSQGAQSSIPSPLSPPEKASIPKLKYEALEISEVRELFERKVLMQYNYFGLLWKQDIYTLQLLLSLFESKVLYTLQLQMGARSKCVASIACLPLNTPLYITLTRILWGYETD